ncbi:hypothetical protein ACQR0Y_09705 [Bradyrhizobium oligotrophicum]|uniref:hypothetical protein n=1 Tax=Bradyrhizobium oligotrophicum TaxID=44255 RepID=UPI003EBD4229
MTMIDCITCNRFRFLGHSLALSALYALQHDLTIHGLVMRLKWQFACRLDAEGE